MDVGYVVAIVLVFFIILMLWAKIEPGLRDPKSVFTDGGNTTCLILLLLVVGFLGAALGLFFAIRGS